MSSRVSDEYSANRSSTVSPLANIRTIWSTWILVPFTHACPWQTRGSIDTLPKVKRKPLVRVYAVWDDHAAREPDGVHPIRGPETSCRSQYLVPPPAHAHHVEPLAFELDPLYRLLAIVAGTL